MVYFDNSATTLPKPQTVCVAVKNAVDSFGNAGRSFCEPSMLASREIFETRANLCALLGLKSPLDIAFTSGATESFNLIISSLISADDHVITTVLEHNSVLRPLYNSGCELDFIKCTENGDLLLEQIGSLVKINTKFIVITHGSNVVGSITNLKKVREIADKYNLMFILDASQTIGATVADYTLPDVVCFTGHKSLFGTMGTGGIIVNREIPLKIVKTGGSGADTFERLQRRVMPEAFEAGTLNAHGLAGLNAGVKFIAELGVQTISEHTKTLTNRFVAGLEKIEICEMYCKNIKQRLPIVSLNFKGISSEELAVVLWEKYQIACRSGFHCAPLLHEHFGTTKRGMVRFSFGYFNTTDEIDYALSALQEIAGEV